MKNRTLIFFLAAIFLLIVTSAHSQKKEMPAAEERSAKLTEWMKTNLQLTDEQVPKVHDINLKYANKTDELSNSAMERRDKMMALKNNDKSKDQELKQVLNASQYQTYLAKKDELKKKFKEKAKAKRKNG